MRHGILGLFFEPEQQGKIFVLEGIYEDLLPLLAGRSYDRQELSSPNANELRIRVTRTRGEGDIEAGGVLEGGDITGADLLLRREPTQLVQVQFHALISSRLMLLLIERAELEVQFDYVRQVPLPVKARTRLRTRGIGRFRMDYEAVTIMDYEGAHNAYGTPFVKG